MRHSKSSAFPFKKLRAFSASAFPTYTALLEVAIKKLSPAEERKRVGSTDVGARKLLLV